MLRMKEKIAYGLGDTASNIIFQTVMMFLLHYVLSQTFDQYARKEVFSHWLGGWGSIIVMVCISVWIAYKTFLDKRIF